MSNLNFLHSGGNKVTLSTPDNNPSSDLTLKLPQADGSSGQFLKTDGSGALSFATALTGPTAPSWTTAASFDCASTNPSVLDVTGLNNPQVVMFVFHELKHSAGSTNHMQIGNDSTGYQASGYFDIGTYRQAGGSETSTRGHNQAQWYPLEYNFGNATNLYSGKILLTRTFNRWIYESNFDISYPSGNNTQYESSWRGHNRDFSGVFQRIKLFNNGGGTYSSGHVTILTQS